MNYNENSIAKDLENRLPEIVKKIAENYNIKKYSNNPFFKDPRIEKWHQFGIIKHTKKVRKIFIENLPLFLQKNEFSKEINQHLSEKIDNLTKMELLEISIPLHDLGKIVLLKDSRTNRNHEFSSKQLIDTDIIKSILISSKLTLSQIEYISRCVETHGILGREIRDRLSSENNFNLKNLSSSKVKKICKQIAEKYLESKIEIGIYFFCDSLGKIDLIIEADTDLEIEQQEQKIEKTLLEKNLNPQLKFAIMQSPINKKLAEIYFKTILHHYR